MKRGLGCARARLSVAEEKRGAVPESMSMICGNVMVEYKVHRKDAYMPVLKLIFKVMTMDKSGHDDDLRGLARPCWALGF